jgi:hypothetical protein
MFWHPAAILNRVCEPEDVSLLAVSGRGALSVMCRAAIALDVPEGSEYQSA